VTIIAARFVTWFTKESGLQSMRALSEMVAVNMLIAAE
jgi:hypothetical protein